MPGRARKDIFDPTVVGVYHCYNRCVRKAFLCGPDAATGQDCSHRKDWIRHRLEELASVFAIDVATHSLMDNHIHVVLRNRPDVAATWSDETVVRRWLQLDAKKLTLRPVDEEEVQRSLQDPDTVAIWRGNLSHISEFMRMLDEPVARAANLEDGVRGHFWQERYKCQRLLDDASLLACSVYVDLNPIRAMLAETPEQAAYTSAYERIQDLTVSATADSSDSPASEQESAITTSVIPCKRSGWLAPISESGDGYAGAAAGRRASDQGLLPMTLERYLEFLDWTGRQVRADKAGAIPQHLSPILDRIGVQPEKWLDTVTHFGRWFGHIVGRASAVIDHATRAGHQRWRGTRRCGEAFG